MQILVVENHHASTLGCVGKTIFDAEVTIQVVMAGSGEPLPDSPEGYDGMIVMGGEMNVLDDNRCPYFPGLVALIRSFHQLERPILGICLGAQLIARAFDAELQLGGPFEFGFHPVTLTQDGKNDPLIGHMAESIHIFQWHTDHYALPRNAVKLVSGLDYPNQSYRIGRTTYAVQFHFEVTSEIVERWFASYPEVMNRKPGSEELLQRQIADHMAPANTFCEEFTRRWLALCA
ncbi:MAG: type 1 glutamine amidotransferase [Rhodospirillales bacterium]|nr:type 1 glutamine amidotransferase [Rhodospirillales bacterium]